MDGKQGASSDDSAAIDLESTKQCENAPASISRVNASHPETSGEKQTDSIYDHFDTKSFRFWERAIARGRFPTSPELADLLEANSGDAIPSWLTPILILGLRSRLKQSGGRPPATVLQSMHLQLAVAMYPRYLSWLKAREKRWGLTGWPLIRESEWWVGPPHERAAKMLTARWLPHMDWRSFLNRVHS
ncbi:hypothetical protein GGQ85_004371 [Nitrobacter vulgaris]|nr:hypothetical protein [Nitrobacter vulgaris]